MEMMDIVDRANWSLVKRRGKLMIRIQVGGKSKRIQKAEKRSAVRDRMLAKKHTVGHNPDLKRCPNQKCGTWNSPNAEECWKCGSKTNFPR